MTQGIESDGGNRMDEDDSGDRALAATVVGWWVTQRNSRENERRKASLELVNRQLSEFYAPMFISCVAGRTAYLTLLQKIRIGADDQIFGEGKEPLKPQIDEWMLWMEHVFMPLNDIREKIVLEKFHLVLPEDREHTSSVAEQIISHVCWCRAMVAKWKKEKDTPGFAYKDLY